MSNTYRLSLAARGIMPKEEIKKCRWIDIEGGDGAYQVSDTGLILSKNRRKWKILKQTTYHGYNYVNIHLYGKWVPQRVHRLIAKAFIPNPENKPEINHKNGIGTDNRIENLEWCTRLENMRHAFDVLKINTIEYPKINRLPGDKKLQESDIYELIEHIRKGKSLYSFAKAKWVSKTYIYDIVHGRSWMHLNIDWNKIYTKEINSLNKKTATNGK